jgi:hypothetical protein
MRKRRRPKEKPQIEERTLYKGRGAPALPFGYPFVKPCNPVCNPYPGNTCSPLSHGFCQPGYPYYPTACMPTYVCLPTTPTAGCFPRSCGPV